ncbi:MAG TPA: CAP domain-containing protein, partial [Acidimicrobiales bacterium]|nr:CAP domain-containing protein [Acidimicrobiales bacterium]
MRAGARFLSVPLGTLVLLGSAGLVGSVSAAGPTLDDPVGAAELLLLANADRALAGLPVLLARDDLTAHALEHSRRMAEAGDIWHDDAYFSAGSKARFRARTVGENVALNRSLADAHRRLMLSDGHRANLLNPRFSIVGFAVVRAADGVGYVTQAFVEPLSGTAPAATAVAPTSGVVPAAASEPAPAAEPPAVPAAASAPVPAALPRRAAPSPPASATPT